MQLDLQGGLKSPESIGTESDAYWGRKSGRTARDTIRQTQLGRAPKTRTAHTPRARFYRLQNVLYYAAFLNEQQRPTGSNQPTNFLDNRLNHIFRFCLDV